MPFDPDALTGALHALAAQDAPPSRVDPDRACAEGRRILRHRRAAAAGLGGTGAVAFAAVAALSASYVAGGGQAAPSATEGPASSRTVHTGDWDPLVAPATFGWLPQNAQNVDYSLAPGPGQGSMTLGKGGQAFDGTAAHLPAMIWLATLAADAPAPKPGPLNDGSGRILIAAPEVNGRAAYWAVDPVKRDPDLGSAGMLYFQSPGGRWAMINAYYLGADPVTATLLHVAQSAHIGDAPVPLPVQISGLPAKATAEVAELDRPGTLAGAAWSVGLSFGVGTAGGFVHVDVYPATATPAAGASFGNPCEVSNGLRICVTTIGSVSPTLLPGGIDGFLHRIKSLGTDPAHWTTDVVIAGS